MGTKALILLADGDIDDAEFLQEAITTIAPHIKVAVVKDEKQTANFLSSCADDELPAAVILDYNMGYFNGIDLLEWICRNERLTGIPKFVWGTREEATYVESCRRMGAVTYFVKPADFKGIGQIAQTIVMHCRF
jgi:DNA-binding response OmpR family regulator